MSHGLRVLAVDDEAPALDELAYLLARNPAVRSVTAVAGVADALRRIDQGPFDVVLLDIRMPGLSGLELARVLGQLRQPPAVVFVSAYEQYAVAAFDLEAAGYLLKPLDEDRLAAVLARVAATRDVTAAGGGAEPEALATIAVELAGTTVLVRRDDVAWVESSGDYVRLHVRHGRSYLVRLPLTALEEHWTDHGFARVHRSCLVALRDVAELRTHGNRTVAVVGDEVLPVSRRHLRELRDRLVGHVRAR